MESKKYLDFIERLKKADMYNKICDLEKDDVLFTNIRPSINQYISDYMDEIKDYILLKGNDEFEFEFQSFRLKDCYNAINIMIMFRSGNILRALFYLCDLDSSPREGVLETIQLLDENRLDFLDIV